MLPKQRSYSDAKIAFVHGRPGPHPTHAALAESVNADFVFVDRILRYHDLEDPGKLRRYASSLLSGLFFKNAKAYDLILSEGMHLPPVIMKKLKILRPDQKIAGIMGNEFLFFLKTKWYPPKTQKLLSYMVRQYDALICMSEFQTELANAAFYGEASAPQIITAHEIISIDRPMPSNGETFDRSGHRLLFVAHGPSGWRGYYKGIETLLETFKLVCVKYPDVELTVIGDWDTEYVNGILTKTDNTGSNIRFIGRQKDLPSFFDNSDLCVHIANGDAFPIATLEAVRAGLPTIVSNLTGTKEVIAKIDEKMVVPMDPIKVSETIEWYFELPAIDKAKLVQRGREVMQLFSAEKGVEEFRAAVNCILEK